MAERTLEEAKRKDVENIQVSQGNNRKKKAVSVIVGSETKERRKKRARKEVDPF
jgi:hypothetical protein